MGMTKDQDTLFDLVNKHSDMQDLIETISDPEVKRLIEVWEEHNDEMRGDSSEN